MSDEIEPKHLLTSTAYWTAAVRASEDSRADRLFADPWAAALAGETGAEWIAQRTDASVIPIVLRSRFYDDFLQAKVTNCPIRQVVLMAAGLDTRAYRLTWPAGVRVFELDQQEILEYKERILRAADAHATCERSAIAGDLTIPWESALIESGFEPNQPSVWLLEGFLFYLSSEDLTGLLDRVLHLAAPGSAVGFDTINRETLTSPYTKAWVDMQAALGAPWIGWLDDPEGFLSTRGWQAKLSVPGDPEVNFGRWTMPVIPAHMPGMPHLWYVTAEKE